MNFAPFERGFHFLIKGEIREYSLDGRYKFLFRFRGSLLLRRVRERLCNACPYGFPKFETYGIDIKIIVIFTGSRVIFSVLFAIATAVFVLLSTSRVSVS
jgi:hypothetical protein